MIVGADTRVCPYGLCSFRRLDNNLIDFAPSEVGRTQTGNTAMPFSLL